MHIALTSTLAYLGVLLIYAGITVVVHAARFARRVLSATRPRRRPSGLDVLLTGTFYNENWFRSHILPLSAARSIRRIYVLTDRPFFALEKVSYRCPPRWLKRVLGRGLVRAFHVAAATIRYRPDVLMGYHIMPNALLCLMAGSIFGGRAFYQMTGGPSQIAGGGCYSENRLLRKLGKPRRSLESLLFAIVRLFDVVVVRGSQAVAFLNEHKLAARSVVIWGSVDVARFPPRPVEKQFDIVQVGRHINEKQPHLFVDLVAEMARRRPGVRAALAGAGPLTDCLIQRAKRLGIEANLTFLGHVDNVAEILARSRLFVLTSMTEGLSIAMVEAMGAGLPVLAPNVGELGELLVDGVTGLFIEPEHVAETARRISELLEDPLRLARMSSQATRRAVALSSPPAVAQRWDACLEGLFAAY